MSEILSRHLFLISVPCYTVRICHTYGSASVNPANHENESIRITSAYSLHSGRIFAVQEKSLEEEQCSTSNFIHLNWKVSFRSITHLKELSII